VPGPRIGEPAPDFTLPATSGSDVTLSALRGSNVVLAFFPLAFTSVCTAEFCDFTAGVGQFQGVNAKVFGISVDAIPSLKEFRKKYDITVDLLSDFKRDVCRRYGTLMEDRFFSRRAYFIVDRKGTLRWSHVEAETRFKRENSELLDQLSRVV
jgi:peroxiredoxin